MGNNATKRLAVLQEIEKRLDRIEQNQMAITFEKLDMAQLALDLRRERDATFPEKYFSDTAWDILLELYRAKRAGKKMQVSLIGYDACISKTTALRYTDILMQDGLVYREDDPSDNRRSYASLTEKAFALMNDLFQGFQSKLAKQSGTLNVGRLDKPDRTPLPISTIAAVRKNGR